MTLNELLKNNHFRKNQTFLASSLNINRNTLRKYLSDTSGLFHFVKVNFDDEDSPYELFTNQTNKG